MRSLARGLEVLDFVARREGTTFSQVCSGTGLPKAVVHRILAELVSSGYVWRSFAQAHYFASPRLMIVPKGIRSQALQRAAYIPLERLVSEVQWPSDLFIRDGIEMILIDTTRPKSPYALKWSRIGRHVPILLSSVGRAVLAAMAESEREMVYAELRRRGEWRRQLRRCSEPLAQIFQDTLSRGYGVREPQFSGEQLERSGIYSIAGSIVQRGEIVGALNIWWPVSADPTKRFAKRYLGPLRQAVDDIRRNLAATERSAGSTSREGAVKQRRKMSSG